ncbi:MAG: glycosyltransferase [Flavobacterium sp.]|nr:glycosyltransferase [Flavobacterium sp.]
MTLFFSYLIITIYIISIFLVFVYGIAQLNLLINYLKSKNNTICIDKFDFSNPDEIPYVTIQLPVFNEKYVIERLLENIVKLEYPTQKIEFQVLDDSTDDSITTTSDLVNKFKNQGIDIKHITRKIRTGFKSGALKEGLFIAKGEFIAIFDADFLPQKDWLKLTIPSFKNPNIGVVQTRWGHLNRDFSILTKIQAFALDAHFTLEQTGRNSQRHCINFNGTAGVWRKSCIIDAGNWEADTLTEDLDLSYRAQLRKWQFLYLEDVVAPAELPAVLSAARSQQFRWNKGGAENFKKLKGRVLSSKNISAKTKFHGILHLLNSSMFLCVFAIAVTSVPMLYIKNNFVDAKFIFDIMAFFIVTSILFFVCYWQTYKSIHGTGLKNFLKYISLFFTFYSIAMGFSFQNSIAVLEGLWGKKSEFVRTPKFNVETIKNQLKENVYISKKISKYTITEGLLSLYFIFGLYVGYKFNDFGLYPFHIMLVSGFGYVFYQSLKNN